MSELSITLTLKSGFIVTVKPLPPYYLDFIDEAYSIKEYPDRELTLAGGDILKIDYTPPEEAPDASDTAEYELYVMWHAIDKYNTKMKQLRDKLRRDFLLSTCVTVESGPISIDDDSWIINIEGALPDYEAPTHDGERRLAFMKAVVVRTQDDLQLIVRSAMFPEVTMQGIEHALQGFQGDMGRTQSRKRHSSKAR